MKSGLTLIKNEWLRVPFLCRYLRCHGGSNFSYNLCSLQSLSKTLTVNFVLMIFSRILVISVLCATIIIATENDGYVNSCSCRLSIWNVTYFWRNRNSASAMVPMIHHPFFGLIDDRITISPCHGIGIDQAHRSSICKALKEKNICCFPHLTSSTQIFDHDPARASQVSLHKLRVVIKFTTCLCVEACEWLLSALGLQDDQHLFVGYLTNESAPGWLLCYPDSQKCQQFCFN